MKTFNLRDTEPIGNRDPLNVRYYIDDKAVDMNRFNSIKHAKGAIVDGFNTANVNGIVSFYYRVRLPE